MKKHIYKQMLYLLNSETFPRTINNRTLPYFSIAAFTKSTNSGCGFITLL